jgi:hypothetical protein
LIVGLLIGSLLPDPWDRVSGLFRFRSDGVAPSSSGHSSDSASLNQSIPVTDNGLATISLSIEDADLSRLLKAREDALNRKQIVAEHKFWIPAQVQLGEEVFRAEVRLKGDLHDHVETEKWSLRIQLVDGKLMGMKVFSIQHPQARGFLWEWWVQQAARMNDLLAPRSDFVNVSLNGRNRGIYYLEEHLAKEMLESQQRRESAIVRLTDENYWAAQFQNRIRSRTYGLVSESIRAAFKPERAQAGAYDEKHLGRVRSLNLQLHQALSSIRELQSLIIESDVDVERSAQLSELRRRKHRTLEDLFDVELLSRSHVLISLFQAGHALLWINHRYYYNPVLSRMEPIVFDCNAHVTTYFNDLVVFDPDLSYFSQSQEYYNHFFRNAGKIVNPVFLERLWDHTHKELRLFGRICG